MGEKTAKRVCYGGTPTQDESRLLRVTTCYRVPTAIGGLRMVGLDLDRRCLIQGQER